MRWVGRSRIDAIISSWLDVKLQFCFTSCSIRCQRFGYYIIISTRTILLLY